MKIKNMKDSHTTRLCFYLIIAIFTFLATGTTAQTITNPVVTSDTTTIRSPGQVVGNPAAYSKPNQSRIWFNSHQNRWDALIPKDDNNGGVSASDHFILKDAPGLQEFTAVELEDRDFARPDVFWDDAGTTLYVLASHPVQSQFWRVGYDIGTDTYNIEVGQLGTGVAVPGITHPNNTAGGNSPATLYVTPNGDVWVAVLASQGLLVQHSSDGGATWLASPVTLDASAATGVTTWIDFSTGGQTFAGVFAGENGEGGTDTDFFFHFINQNSDPTVLTNWINDSGNIPPAFGAEQSDDHVSAAKDNSGNQYFAVKTENGNPTDPLIKLYQRTPGGVWSQFKVTETQDFPEESRPSIVIDDDNAEINIFTNGAEVVSSTEREGNRISAPLNSLDNFASAVITPVFSGPGKIFTDIMTPRSSVNAVSGIAVLAHNRTDSTVWFSFDDGQIGAVLVPDVAGLSQAAAEQAIVNAGLAVGAITTANSDTVPAGNVISQDPTAGSSVPSGSAVDLVVSSGPGIVTAVTVPVDQDSWLKQAARNDNFGDEKELPVKNKQGDSERAVFRFDLSAIPPNSKINGATATFRVTTPDNRPVNLFRITNGWTEFGVTWRTTGNAFDQSTVRSSFTPFNDDSFVSVDLTDLVQDWVCGTPNHGVILIATSDDEQSKYHSRDIDIPSFRPSMDVKIGSDPSACAGR